MIRKSTIAALVGGATLGSGSVYLINASGGSVSEYVVRFDQLAQTGKKVIVRGDCASSCTMMLGYPNMCLDAKANLRFHPAYNSAGFMWVLNPVSNQEMISHYPPDAWKVIERHGDLADPPKWGWGAYPPLFSIPAKEFPEHLCERPT